MPLTADELSEWVCALRVWEPIGDIAELAEIMAALEPEEREQIWRVVPTLSRVRREVEDVLGSSH